MAYQASMIFDNELTPKKGAKIPFGIHTKCKVTSLEYKAGEYLDLNFEDSEGRFHNKRLWQPNGKYPQTIKLPDGTERTETTAQALEREEVSRLSHVVKLMDIFLGKEEVKKFPPLDYDPFIKRAIQVLEPHLNSKLVNLKLIYDSEGIYSTFGNFPDYVEAHTEGKEPELFFSKWEKENRCTFKGKSAEAGSGNDEEINALFKNKA